MALLTRRLPARRDKFLLYPLLASTLTRPDPAELVRRAFELARVVYGLYHAVSYQFILNNLDEMGRAEINTAHYFLRQVLKELASMDR